MNIFPVGWSGLRKALAVSGIVIISLMLLIATIGDLYCALCSETIFNVSSLTDSVKLAAERLRLQLRGVLYDD